MRIEITLAKKNALLVSSKNLNHKHEMCICACVGNHITWKKFPFLSCCQSAFRIECLTILECQLTVQSNLMGQLWCDTYKQTPKLYRQSQNTDENSCEENDTT